MITCAGLVGVAFTVRAQISSLLQFNSNNVWITDLYHRLISNWVPVWYRCVSVYKSNPFSRMVLESYPTVI